MRKVLDYTIARARARASTHESLGARGDAFNQMIHNNNSLYKFWLFGLRRVHRVHQATQQHPPHVRLVLVVQ